MRCFLSTGANRSAARLGDLRRAEEQAGRGPQREMEDLEHLLLRLAVKVDQQVAAA